SYNSNEWNKIIKFCKSAQAFQDAPFSWPYTWLFLYKAYPKAKFILTIREEEAWYNSITKFHTKLFSKENKVPTKQELMEANYRYKGFIREVNRAVWKTPEDDLYNKELLLKNYRSHNESILHFFKNKPNFLCIDVSKEDSYVKLAEFIGRYPLHDKFPHLNKTENK